MRHLLLILLLFGLGSAQEKRPSLEKISESVWIHKSYEEVAPWGMVLSQGLFVQTKDHLIMVDTAWDDRGTEILFRLALDEIGAIPDLLIVTHAHRDKMGGMKAAHRLNPNISSYAHPLTLEDAPKRGLLAAKLSTLNWPKDLGLEVFYPGPAHARDNIVVYHPADQILFGGCLVRPGTSKNLGNTADGNIQAWAHSTQKIQERFPEIRVVVPSHGKQGGPELLDHTIELSNECSLLSFWKRQRKSIETKDTEALLESFDIEAKLTTLAGGQLNGHKSLKNFWDKSLQSLGSEARLEWKLIESRLNSANTASLYGQWETKSATVPAAGYPTFGYFLEELKRQGDQWRVERAYFWGVTEGHTRHLRPKPVE